MGGMLHWPTGGWTPLVMIMIELMRTYRALLLIGLTSNVEITASSLL